jgi:pimeloyl-ACP methyl ester carboxylesterase
MPHILAACSLMAVLAAAAAPAVAQTPSAAPGAPIVKPCPKDQAEGFECITLSVPLDHFHDTGRTTDVAFAIKRHTGEGPGKGVFVTATGGPGTSGIQSAVSYRDAFSASIQRDYDVVFFDQRGAHLSGDLTCPEAASTFYRSTSSPADSTATTGLGADAQVFVATCLAESKADPALLPYYSTRQAAEDLESFRQYLGADTIQLYGESYGTQLVQTYAAAHPDHLAGLFVDGPVDLSHSLLDYYQEQTKGFEEALIGTLLDCSTQKACTTDVTGANAWTAWDALDAQLDAGDVPFSFHSRQGIEQMRLFTASDLLNAVSAYLYSEGDRMLLQRALAAASQGDLWYLSRLLYSGLEVDPETQRPVPDPSYSDALYYAVECLDYGLPGATAEERAAAYLQAGHDRGMETATMGDVFYGDLPCAFWPAQPDDTSRPADLTDVPYPMFVMGATLDPATPWANAERIVTNAGDNAYLIVKPGGPHIIFGRGEPCPDGIVTAFLEHGTLPSSKRTVCPGGVADDYVPIPPLIAVDYPSTKAALKSADDEITTSVDYWAWDGESPLATGCRFGGTISYTPVKRGSELKLDACSWSRGLSLTGSGLIDDDAGTLSLRVSQDGAPGETVRYDRNAKGKISVHGDLAMFVNR